MLKRGFVFCAPLRSDTTPQVVLHQRVHSHRIAGGHRHHRGAGGIVVTRRPAGARAPPAG